jgi:hypothetical protein
MLLSPTTITMIHPPPLHHRHHLLHPDQIRNIPKSFRIFRRNPARIIIRKKNPPDPPPETEIRILFRNLLQLMMKKYPIHK